MQLMQSTMAALDQDPRLVLRLVAELDDVETATTLRLAEAFFALGGDAARLQAALDELVRLDLAKSWLALVRPSAPVSWRLTEAGRALLGSERPLDRSPRGRLSQLALSEAR